MGLTNFGTQCYGLTVLWILAWFKLYTYTHNIYRYFIWIWQPIGWITMKHKHDKTQLRRTYETDSQSVTGSISSHLIDMW